MSLTWRSLTTFLTILFRESFRRFSVKVSTIAPIDWKVRALFAVIVAHLLDFLTTNLPYAQGYESNVWARTAAHTPINSHLVVLKLAFAIGAGLPLYLIYKTLAKWSQNAADLLVVGVLSYQFYDVFGVVLTNTIIFLNWYQA